jgi:hypothetical protein
VLRVTLNTINHKHTRAVPEANSKIEERSKNPKMLNALRCFKQTKSGKKPTHTGGLNIFALISDYKSSVYCLNLYDTWHVEIKEIMIVLLILYLFDSSASVILSFRDIRLLFLRCSFGHWSIFYILFYICEEIHTKVSSL